jgi:hypothetical protein
MGTVLLSIAHKKNKKRRENMERPGTQLKAPGKRRKISL